MVNVIDEELRVFRSSDATWRAFDGEVTIISLTQNRLRQLNEVGSMVWAVCDGRPVREVIDEVARRYQIETARARADVAIFLEDLRSRGLIELR